MKTKVANVIQRVESLYSKGVSSNDSRLSPILVYNTFATIRAQVLVRKLNQKQRISNLNMYTLDCIELEEASAHDCSCYPADKCKIKKSVYQLPKIISSNFGDKIVVTSIDGAVNFSKTSFEKVKYIAGEKYGHAIQYFYIKDGYLYTINSRAEVVLAIALFSDVLEQYYFVQKCSSDDKCLSNYDVEFEMDEDLLNSIIKMTAEELLTPFIKTVALDITNDGRDNIIDNKK